MKHFGKNSISSALRIIIDLALVLELLIVTATVWQIFQFLLPSNDSEKVILFVLLSQSIFGIISLLITLQLRKLINAFKKEAFFELKNAKRIQNISLLLFLFVIFDLVLSQFNPNQHSIEIIARITGYMPIINAFLSFVFTINFKILFLSAIIYVISHIFRNGYELKEQTTLTI